jgi:hypothetical protein
LKEPIAKSAPPPQLKKEFAHLRQPSSRVV